MQQALPSAYCISLCDFYKVGTPLHWAAKAGHIAVIRILLDHRVEVNFADRTVSVHTRHRQQCILICYWITTLWIQRTNAVERVVCALQSTQGRTALHWAALRGFLKAVSLIIQHEDSVVDLEDQNVNNTRTLFLCWIISWSFDPSSDGVLCVCD